MSSLLMVVVIEALVSPGWVPTHLFGPLKIRLILNFLQYLKHWLFKQWIDQLSSCRWHLIRKLLSRAITLVSSSPRIPLLWEQFSLTFSLYLVLLHPLILIYAIHKLAYVQGGLHRQRLSQLVLNREPNFKSPHSHILRVSINLIMCPFVSTFSAQKARFEKSQCPKPIWLRSKCNFLEKVAFWVCEENVQDGKGA